MSQHPANILLRLALQITALVSAGQLGWQMETGILRYLYAIGLPLLLIVLWMAFTVPDDPVHSSPLSVRVPGRVRLAIEWLLYLFAAWTMFAAGHSALGLAFLVGVILHYIWSLDRVFWLIRR